MKGNACSGAETALQKQVERVPRLTYSFCSYTGRPPAALSEIKIQTWNAHVSTTTIGTNRLQMSQS